MGYTQSDDGLMPPKIAHLIKTFQILPGIGQKNAQRLVFFLLGLNKNELLAFADAIRDVGESNQTCSECMNFCETDICDICASDERSKETLCIVEGALDVIAIEQSQAHKGIYHVLHGVLSPQNGIGPRDLKTDTLVDRIKQRQVKEVIIATSLNMEGEATAAYLSSLLKPLDVAITRIARGIPTGSVLEYADSDTIAHALKTRVGFDTEQLN